MCLTAFIPMLATMKVPPENMRKAAAGGFINATDCADYLVKKACPSGCLQGYRSLVGPLHRTGRDLESLPIEEYQRYAIPLTRGVYEAISLENCVNGRNSGRRGPAKDKGYWLQVKRCAGIGKLWNKREFPLFMIILLGIVVGEPLAM